MIPLVHTQQRVYYYLHLAPTEQEEMRGPGVGTFLYFQGRVMWMFNIYVFSVKTYRFMTTEFFFIRSSNIETHQS